MTPPPPGLGVLNFTPTHLFVFLKASRFGGGGGTIYTYTYRIGTKQLLHVLIGSTVACLSFGTVYCPWPQSKISEESINRLI